MKNDKDFGIGEDYLKLGVEIIYIDEYIKCYGDEELVI